MDLYHRQLLRLAVYVSGDGELKLFTLHKAFLKLLGYDWWDPPGWTIRKVFKSIVYPIAYLVFLVTEAVLTINRCFELDIQTDLGFFIFMNNIICTFTFCYTTFKTIYLKFFYGKEVKLMIEYIESIGELKEKSVWLNSLKWYTYWWLMTEVMVGAWTFYFLIIYDVAAIQATYPWYQEHGFGRVAAYFLSFMGGFVSSIILATIDSIMTASCAIIICHLIVLKDMLQTVGDEKSSDKQIISKCVDLHVKVISAAEKMNYCFNLLFASQAVYTVLHACILIFTFVKAGDVIGAICATMPMLVATYSELLMFSYFGQMLSSSFEDITFASYNNNWYDCDLSIQKSLMNISMISEKPVALRGLGNYKASYASYLESFQESISYYLILKTLTGSNDDE